MKQKPLKFNRIVEGSFNDQAYLDAYIERGEFPAIHDQVAHLIRTAANEHEPAFDFGSCTGLLSVQAVALGRSQCIGIEGNELDFKRAMKLASMAVRFENFFINTDTMYHLKCLLDLMRPTLVIARRVLPEIHHNDSETLDILPGVLYSFGVNKIIVQGRVKVKNPKTPLFCTDKEVEVFAPFYKETQRYRQTALLEAVERGSENRV